MLRRALTIIGLMLWVAGGFVVVGFIIGELMRGLADLGISLSGLDSATAESIMAAIIYIVTLVMIIGVPWFIWQKKTTKKELGLHRLATWTDIGLSVGGLFVYLVASGVLAMLAQHIFSDFPTNQAQDVGFSHLSQRYEYILAFFTLVVVAPLAEETLFRGYLYGKIRKRAPFIVTMLLVSLAFAILHLPGLDAAGHIQWQWNVVLDVFALSLVLTSLREVTGSIWAGVFLHMIKNGIAFYFLFIVPLTSIMGH